MVAAARSRPSCGSRDGRVLGNPTPATVGDAVRINPLPSPKPAALKRKTVIVKVPATTRARADQPRRLRAPTPAGTSTTGEREGGRKKASTSRLAPSAPESRSSALTRRQRSESGSLRGSTHVRLGSGCS